jgi:glutamate 5-kinase
MKRIVIKVGTSTLTQGSGPPDESYIFDLARQIAQLSRTGAGVILVTSGSITAGMAALELSGRPRTIPQKQAAAAVGQGLLMQTYARAFAACGLTVGQVLLTREDLRDRTRYLNARNTFTALLKYGAVPIVNENDTVAVDEIKFGDNDTLAALVGSLVEATHVLLLSDVDGLYDKDPRENEDARLIRVVQRIDKSIERLGGGVRSGVGTGGMVTKISAARICATAGIDMTIADGRRPNVVEQALAGQCGTLFLPDPNPLRQRQRWIAFGQEPRGSIEVNDGARQHVLDGGKSLLPAGIVSVSGEFRAGEMVGLIGPEGKRFARGFVNYGHEQIALIKGRRSSEIQRILGSKTYDEVVHRDNLVLDI